MIVRIKEVGQRICHDIEEYWAAALVLILYTIVVNLIFHAFCPMVIIFGFPCPGCGLTRSLIYLLSGQIAQSVYINPMGIPVFCILTYFFWNRYIIGRNAKWIMPFTVGAIILLVMLYFWRMYNFFPNRIPYVYTENNILSKSSAFYQQILHDLNIL